GVLAGDLVRSAAQEHHGIGRGKADVGGEGELDLARPVLAFERAQGEAERDEVAAQDLERWLELVVACLGEEVVALREEAHVGRSEEHTSELQSLTNLVCRLLLEKKQT